MILPILPWMILAALYAPLFVLLYYARWQASDYTHAYFILPLALWLAWRLRKQIHSTSPGSLISYFYLLVGLIVFVFGWREDYTFIATLSLIPTLFGMTGCLLGRQAAKILSFPILYLLLLVPIPLGILDAVTLPMRYGTSIAAAGILKGFHYPIERSGLLLFLGTHEIFMGQPCSGFRSLISLLSLSLIYIHLSKSHTSDKIILSLLTVPMALAGNLLRVLALCLITYHFGEAAGQGFFHGFSGVVVFLILIAGLLGTETLLARFHRHRDAKTTAQDNAS